MIEGSCHCNAVSLSYSGTPRRLVSCNCSICRRLGALWGHGPASVITVTAAPGALLSYSHGDGGIAFCTCKTCGTTTHWESTDKSGDYPMAMNMNTADSEAVSGLPLRHFDGADSWTFLD